MNLSRTVTNDLPLGYSLRRSGHARRFMGVTPAARQGPVFMHPYPRMASQPSAAPRAPRVSRQREALPLPMLPLPVAGGAGTNGRVISCVIVLVSATTRRPTVNESCTRVAAALSCDIQVLWPSLRTSRMNRSTSPATRRRSVEFPAASARAAPQCARRSDQCRNGGIAWDALQSIHHADSGGPNSPTISNGNWRARKDSNFQPPDS